MPCLGAITVGEFLDHECKSSHLLTVSAGTISLPFSTQAIVNITVLDINDNTPMFIQTSYAVQVSEETKIGSIILEVSSSTDHSDSTFLIPLESLEAHINSELFFIL